mgnify:CR=1 FL=1
MSLFRSFASMVACRRLYAGATIVLSGSLNRNVRDFQVLYFRRGGRGQGAGDSQRRQRPGSAEPPSGLDDPAMREWGWRLPFLLSLGLLAVSLWIRLQLEETERLANQRIRRNGSLYVSFSCNDYLGLTQHPALKARVFRPAGRAVPGIEGDGARRHSGRDLAPGGLAVSAQTDGGSGVQAPHIERPCLGLARTPRVKRRWDVAPRRVLGRVGPGQSRSGGEDHAGRYEGDQQ